jgi:hypothetical protein
MGTNAARTLLSTARVESTVDQLVDWRMEKKQHMRWTRRGAQMLRCCSTRAVRYSTTQRRTGQIHPMVALRIIAGAGSGGMTPRFSSPSTCPFF